jgi:hypothetical protein
MTEADDIREDRERLRKENRHLFDEISSILFVADLMGINFEMNTDEYEPEVGTILPRLKNCNSVDDVRQVVHEEFVRWFSPDVAGAESRYEKVAKDIWKAWGAAGGHDSKA